MPSFTPFILAALFPVLAGAQPASDELPPQKVMPAPDGSAWQPPQAQARRLVQVATGYFADQDGGRFEAAYALFSLDQKRLMPYETWQARGAAFHAKAGALQSRTIRKITWYRNPPDAPPGVYVATDFSDQFENTALHCGFVSWHQRMDGSFEIVHEEDNLIDKATAARMSPEMLQRAHAAFRC
jgi:hypothetical protein